jgi:1-acyl-sn-glycerol-3-phosphate acyltransferase
MNLELEYYLYSPVMRLFLGKIRGSENLPTNKPFIAAANHASYIDDILIPYILFGATKRKFSVFVNSRFYKNKLIKAYLDHYSLIPVDVSKDVNNLDKRKKTNSIAMERALNYLKGGKNFIIFPEGGRSHDGKIKKAKFGVAAITLKSKVPVVPIGIRGSYDILPKGSKLPRLKKANVYIGKPMNFNKYSGEMKDKKTLEKVTRKIMKEVAELAGQKYNY